MSWNRIEGNWMHFKASVRGNWVKLTDDDLARVGGCREELVKRLQARYGFCQARSRTRNRSLDEGSAARRLSGFDRPGSSAPGAPPRRILLD